MQQPIKDEEDQPVIIKTKRWEVDVHVPSLLRLDLAGTFIRLPLVGEMYCEPMESGAGRLPGA
jgi:hypothetical protein